MDLKHSVILAATFMASKKWIVSSFQQIEATMLDAQGAVSFQQPTPLRGEQLDSSTSIDQHLQGYDRFHLRIPIH